jgi:uncharacterized membrane protein
MLKIIIILILLFVGIKVIEFIGDNFEIWIALAVIGLLIFLFFKLPLIIRVLIVVAIIIAIIIAMVYFQYERKVEDFESQINRKGRSMALAHEKAYSLDALKSEYKSSKLFSEYMYENYLRNYIEQLFRQTAIFTLDEFVYLNQFYLTDISTEKSGLLQMLDKNSNIYTGDETVNPFSADDWDETDDFTVKLHGDTFDNYKRLIVPYLDKFDDIVKLEISDIVLYKIKSAKENENNNLVTVEISLD